MFQKSMKVFPFSFFFFKLLRLIIVSFHLAFINFCIKNSFSIYFFPDIFIRFEYTVIRYVSLWSSYRQSDVVDAERYIVLKKPKMLLPRSFLPISFSVWRVNLFAKKKWRKKKVKVYFYVIHLTVTWFCCSRRETCLR